MSDARAGAALRAVRIRRGWRQQDVADRAGVARTIVARLERGRLDEVAGRRARPRRRRLDVRLDIVAAGRAANSNAWSMRATLLCTKRLARLSALPGWQVEPEVSFAIYGERGSSTVGWHAGRRALLVIELKTEIVDVQALIGPSIGRRLAAARRRRSGMAAAAGVDVGLLAESRTKRSGSGRTRHSAPRRLPTDGRGLAGWLADPMARVDGLTFLPYCSHGTLGAT